MIDLKILDDFRVSPYNAYRIMGGTIGLTDSQQSELDGFLLREQGEGRPLTVKQKEKMDELILKKDSGELSQGAKTYVQEWVNEKVYGIRKPLITTKEMAKGLMREDDAIEYFAECIGEEFCLKNNRKIDNGMFRGVCDIELEDRIVDIKVPWSNETMPLFETKISNLTYFYQLHAYMWMYGKNDATLAYVLMDTPDILVEKEAKKEFYSPSNEKKLDFLLDKWKKIHTFEHLPMSLRLKTFDLERDDKIIDEFKIRFNLCKEYATQIIININNN